MTDDESVHLEVKDEDASERGKENPGELSVGYRIQKLFPIFLLLLS